jgi:lipopolysaccharide export system protein LptA
MSHSGAGNLKSGEDLDDLLSAVQQGHISMMRRAPAKKGDKVGAKPGRAKEDVQRATAERAAYDGDLDRVTLTGGVQFSDADSVLWANQVALDRATGDAQAVGGSR